MSFSLLSSSLRMSSSASLPHAWTDGAEPGACRAREGCRQENAALGRDAEPGRAGQGRGAGTYRLEEERRARQAAPPLLAAPRVGPLASGGAGHAAGAG